MIKQMKSLLKEKSYLFCISLAFLLGYGFFFSYVSLYVDDTAMGRYFADGRLLRQGRWGVWLLTNILHQTEFNPFIHKICGMLVFFVACVLIGSLLREMSGNKMSIRSVTIFSCVMVTYSMINEILFYVSSQWLYSLIYFMSALSVWYLMRGKKFWNLLSAVILLTLGLSITEGAAGVYIILVIACMILIDHYQVGNSNRMIDYVKSGGIYIGVLISAIVLERVLAFIFCAVTGCDMQVRSLLWSDSVFLYVLKNMVSTIFINYGIRSIFYFPIAEYLIAALFNLGIIFWLCFHRKGTHAFLWLMFATGSVIFSIVQGEACPNRVIWQVFAVYIGFMAAMACERVFEVCKKKIIKSIVTGGMCLVVLWQISDLNMWEWVNYMRNHEEMRIVNDLGRELESNFDIEEKPVVFVGEYQLSENILQYTHVQNGSEKDLLARKVMDLFPGEIGYQQQYVDDYGYRFNETGSNSVITWGVYAFQEVNTELLKIFAQYGYAFQQGTMEMYEQGLEKAKNMPRWPRDGAIIDMGAYILVNFGGEN